ncbi:hypothetical protein RA19_13630 [Leisingera sp. ANG-M1]|nr:hypothetical protein RA19_13630 [Leisingera sp. ANG-M1]
MRVVWSPYLDIEFMYGKDHLRLLCKVLWEIHPTIFDTTQIVSARVTAAVIGQRSCAIGSDRDFTTLHSDRRAPHVLDLLV